MDAPIKAAAYFSTSIENAPYTADAEHSGFFTAHGVKIYDYYEQNQAKGKIFAQAMSAWSQRKPYAKSVRKGTNQKLQWTASCRT
jgi:hypothetical protein